ncbi:hypothetical protein [Burkholderia anthina]|uniref:hypothetical protein n=1 Tax=Burkholderia anthina TaxID=179879 RepID=UPI001AA08CA6|nr:hypothetical protein [Burkholderia anthina]QTD95305.1 hypothetical protein J4G50_37175 [Burkholderia anthina]
MDTPASRATSAMRTGTPGSGAKSLFELMIVNASRFGERAVGRNHNTRCGLLRRRAPHGSKFVDFNTGRGGYGYPSVDTGSMRLCAVVTAARAAYCAQTLHDGMIDPIPLNYCKPAANPPGARIHVDLASRRIVGWSMPE